MAACAPFLRRQLEVLDPALVVTLGRFSLGTFMPGTRISQVHGTVRPVDAATGARAARAFAMYHPAAALRQGALKETMRDDMSRVPAALIASRQERATLPAPEPERAPEPELVAHAAPEPEHVALVAPEPVPPRAVPVAHAAPERELEPPMPADLIDTLETLDDLAPLEVLGIANDHPPETDQMRLF